MAERFWHLTNPESTARLAEWVHDEVELSGVTCSLDPGHQRAGKRLGDLSVELPDSKVQDVVWTWYSECLMQERALGILRSRRFTGYVVQPTRTRYHSQSQVSAPPLFEIVVTGWAGVAPSDSGIRLEQSCPECGLLRYSCFTNPERLIDEARWDGSDFFIVWPLPAFIFVTDRVKSALEREKVTGVRFIAPTELRCGAAGLGPGRLSYWMPEERARELGEPLGIY